MPCCAVLGCSNRAGKGSKMHRFPRDPKRRRLWEILVCRENWNASNSSFLCADHFEETQYEQHRADNLRRLKPNALPTRFAFNHREHFDDTEYRQVKKRRPSTMSTSVTMPHRVKVCPHQAPSRRSKGSITQNKAFYCRQIQREHSYSTHTDLSQPDDTPKSSTDSEPSMTADAGKEDGKQLVEEQAGASEQLQSLSQCSSSKLGTAPCKCVAMEREIRRLRQKLAKERKEKRLLRQQRVSYEGRVAKVFGKDQWDRLCGLNGGESNWSAETMKKALQLRFACSATGYELLLAQGHPLPSVHFLRKWLEEINLEPGVFDEVFDLLKLKVVAMEKTQRECCLMLDEMALQDGLKDDIDSSGTQGSVFLQNHTRTTTNTLVIMLRGVSSHWKQIVAFHAPGSSENEVLLKPLVLKVIQKAHNIGLHVTAVASASESINLALWRSFGISCSKFKTTNKVPHPCGSGRHLHFLADVHHVIENLRIVLVTGNTITLSQETLSDFQLPSEKVTVEHLQKLVNFQKDRHKELAPGLTRAIAKSSHSLETNSFDALNFFSPSVSSALRYLVKCEGHDPALETTAWYIEFMSGWFELMSNRHPVLALSYNNRQAYDKAVAHLERAVQVTEKMSFGNEEQWEPFQTELVVTTKSILDLQAELIDRGHPYVLTAHFANERLASLFQSIQTSSPTPTHSQYLAALKIITAEHLLE